MHCLVCKKPIPKSSRKRLCSEHSNADNLFKSVDLLKSEDFFGKSPNIFIGSYGYPHVNVGILSPPERKEDAWLYDAPNFWAENEFDKMNVLSLRSSLINSRFRIEVKNKNNRFLDLAQEIGMASKPVDIDIALYKKPIFKLNLSDITLPIGPKANLRYAKLAENPKVLTKVDKVVSDTDLKSVEALKLLYDRGINENDLIKLLSVGNLGVKIQRKLVPTKWSITATHDTLGKYLINKVKDYNSTDYSLYFGGYMNNYFLVLMFPDVWGFELFETYVSGDLTNLNYTRDFEFYNGRKSYALNCTGGYYACRLGVLEKLNNLRKQSSILVLRFTTPEYDTSLGVWIVLEATRKAVANKVLKFNSREEMLDYAKKFILKKFKIDINQFLKKSKLLFNIKSQKKLTSFF